MDGTIGFFGAALPLLHAACSTYVAKGVDRKLETRVAEISKLPLSFSILLTISSNSRRGGGG
jgi:hypothetical protein